MKTYNYIFLIFCLLLFGCDSSTDSTGTELTIQPTVRVNGLLFSLSVDTTEFDLLDTLQASFQVTNESDTIKVFRFVHIQQFGYILSDDKGAISMYQPMIVSPALCSLILEPKESKTYSINSLFKDHNGNYIERKKYLLSSYLLEGNSPKVYLPIVVK